MPETSEYLAEHTTGIVLSLTLLIGFSVIMVTFNPFVEYRLSVTTAISSELQISLLDSEGNEFTSNELVAGENDTVYFELYVENSGGCPCTLRLDASNNVSWNYEGQTIQPNEQLKVRITIKVEYSGNAEFTYDIVARRA